MMQYFEIKDITIFAEKTIISKLFQKKLNDLLQSCGFSNF